jgi:hypothetical protein
MQFIHIIHVFVRNSRLSLISADAAGYV